VTLARKDERRGVGTISSDIEKLYNYLLGGIKDKDLYFYVDESGHTGTNLFDENRPILYYGVLSSRVNIDALAEKILVSLRKRLGVDRLHASAKDVPMVNGPGLSEISFKGMPTIPISFKSSTASPGLELVDIYLWIFKRLMEEKELAPEVYPILKKQLHKSSTDEISINAIASRWQKWFDDLPEPTDEQKNSWQ